MKDYSIKKWGRKGKVAYRTPSRLAHQPDLYLKRGHRNFKVSKASQVHFK